MVRGTADVQELTAKRIRGFVDKIIVHQSYSTEVISDWLASIQEAPTQKAIKLLVERIDVEQQGKKIDFRVESTLKSIPEMVAGELFVLSIQTLLPVLLEYKTVKSA